MHLVNGKVGATYIVENISLRLETNRRLQALGLTKGTKITVLNNKKSGSVIFSVRGSRLAVGKEIATGLEVKEAE
ncbi:MAG TPA: ferrous iron transport protein A [Lachnospiraceae bacterium]|nr:FeoA family protein [uncultured Lachnoclostridium sp.]HAU88232.1 ferrous iron transport protein A [Lachnospiraceae bacterium]